MNQLIALIVDESRWLTVSMGIALVAVIGSVIRFYLIGVALAAPSWSLIYHTRRLLASDDDRSRASIRLNAWLAITLLALGLHNLPLAAPGFLNIGYQLQSRRVVGWAIVGIAVVVNVLLFIGSLIFLASGQSFEQLRGIQ